MISPYISSPSPVSIITFSLGSYISIFVGVGVLNILVVPNYPFFVSLFLSSLICSAIILAPPHTSQLDGRVIRV